MSAENRYVNRNNGDAVFHWKCQNCGSVHDYNPDKCAKCGSTIFDPVDTDIKPDRRKHENRKLTTKTYGTPTSIKLLYLVVLILILAYILGFI